MVAASLIIGFIIYSLGLFWISDWRVLLALFLAELCLICARSQHTSLRAAVKFLLRSVGFVSFVVLCNCWSQDLASALVVGARLLLALMATYYISLTLTARDLAQGVAWLLAPLQLLKVNTRDLAITVAIALSFVPVLSAEARAIRQSLLVKGFEFKLANVLRRPQLYVTTYLDNLWQRVEELERSLYLKGYN